MPPKAAASAAHEISHGRYAKHFWCGQRRCWVMWSHLSLLLLTGNCTSRLAVPQSATIVGLYLFEHAFVMAPQELGATHE